MIYISENVMLSLHYVRVTGFKSLPLYAKEFTLYTGYRFQEFTFYMQRTKSEYSKAAGYILATFSKVKFCVDADKMALELLYYLSYCTT